MGWICHESRYNIMYCVEVSPFFCCIFDKNFKFRQKNYVKYTLFYYFN